MLTNADRAHLNRALRIAESSTCKNRHGAVIAQGRRILSVGINTFRSNPNNVTDPKNEASFHAEISALRGLRSRSDGLSLYVGRLSRQGNSLLSKPCMRCWDIISSSGISRVVYSADGGGYGILLA